MARLRTTVNNIIAQKVETVQVEIAAQKTMSHAELADCWRQVFGTVVPHNLSKRLLIHALAHELQVREYGGLKKATKVMLADAFDATCQIDKKQNCPILNHTGRSSTDADAAALTHHLQCALTAEDLSALMHQHQLPKRLSPPVITLSPGTRLMREWRGAVYVVDIVEGGFMWNGKVYRSLSAIARAITSVRWNGLAFFGLRKRNEGRTNKASNPLTDASTNDASQQRALECPSTLNGDVSSADNLPTTDSVTPPHILSPITDQPR